MCYLEKRNVAIDLLRALTMATMLMVNDFWSVTGIPHWMEHAKWGEDMLGFSDLVFPTFLFCVGLSIPYAISSMRRKGKSEGDVIRHILSRSFALILMGAFICNYEEGIDPAIGYDRSVYSLLMTLGFFLIYCKYPNQVIYSRWSKCVGWLILGFLLITSRSPQGATFYPYWWGILGLIGWAYLFCSLVYALSQNWITSIVVWLVLLLVCLCCSDTATYSCFEGNEILSLSSPNIVNLTLDILHIGNASSHLLVMSGVLFSMFFIKLTADFDIKKRFICSIGLAVVCVLLGVLSHQWFIVSKLIGTLPWIFFTLALDVVLYALFDILVYFNKSHWFNPIKSAGTATLTCYMIPYVLYPLISMTFGWSWSSGIPAPLGFFKCVAFSALCILITWLLSKMSIRLKI